MNQLGDTIKSERLDLFKCHRLAVEKDNIQHQSEGSKE